MAFITLSMFQPMRRPHKLLVLAAVSAAAGVAPALAAATTPGANRAPAATTTTNPSPRQITAAIKTAESSSQLWATINSCDLDADHRIGIRAEMPALTFNSKLVMLVNVDEFSSTQYRYVPVKASVRLANKVFPPGAVVQEGVTLHWSGSVTVIGRVTFEWFEGSKLLGSTTRTTTSGHPDDAGSPARYSVGTCSIT
jgi:hypothetical protein